MRLPPSPQRPYTENTVRTGLRLPVTLHERLKVAADERVVSVNFLVNKAVQWYLDELPDVDEMLAVDPGLWTAAERSWWEKVLSR